MDESGVSHPEVPCFLKEETRSLHACGYRVLCSARSLLPGILEVDFKPIVPVPKSQDSSGKLLLRVERMPPMTGWLVDLWGRIDPEGWDGCKSRIFIVEQQIVYSHEVSLGVWHRVSVKLSRGEIIRPVKSPMDYGVLWINDG